MEVSVKVQESIQDKFLDRNRFDYLEEYDIWIDFQINIKEFELFIENYNSCIYKCKINNENYLIKQSKIKNDKKLRLEYNTLKDYQKLDLKGFRFPKVFNYSNRKQYYIMQYVLGDNFSNLVLSKVSSDETKAFFQNLGENLAEFHIHMADKELATLKKEYVVYDILNAYNFYPHEKTVVKFYNSYCADKKYLVGYAHDDFDPVNILINNETHYLIDAPDNKKKSYLIWDLATFIVGLKKEILKKKPWYIFYKTGGSHISVFLESYFDIINSYYGIEMTYTDTLIFQLQRIEVLLVYQTYPRDIKMRTKIKTEISKSVLKVLRRKLLIEMQRVLKEEFNDNKE